MPRVRVHHHPLTGVGHLKRIVCLAIAGVVFGGCHTYIEYQRVPPGMKAVIDACAASGGRAFGPIADTMIFDNGYSVTCLWSKQE